MTISYSLDSHSPDHYHFLQPCEFITIQTLQKMSQTCSPKAGPLWGAPNRLAISVGVEVPQAQAQGPSV